MVIGINGFKNSGKDTAARYLINEHGFKRIAFGDKVKECFATLFGISVPELEFMKNDPAAHVAIGYMNYPPKPVGVDTSLVDESDGSVRMWSPAITPITVRNGLQRVGTDIGRNILGKEIWVNLVRPEIEGNVVITDIRFENEIEALWEYGAQIIRISRDSTDPPDPHVSEMWLDDDYIDVELANNSSIQDLHKSVAEIYEELLGEN